jgi:hypothetical protein
MHHDRFFKQNTGDQKGKAQEREKDDQVNLIGQDDFRKQEVKKVGGGDVKKEISDRIQSLPQTGNHIQLARQVPIPKICGANEDIKDQEKVCVSPVYQHKEYGQQDNAGKRKNAGQSSTKQKHTPFKHR